MVGGPVGSTITNRESWARAFLNQLGNTNPSNEVVAFVVAWETMEGGGVGTENVAHYNPLNTTQPASGSTSVNSVGVRSYATQQSGLDASTAVIRNGRYPSLLHALQTNDVGSLGLAGQPIASNVAGDLSVWVKGSNNPIDTAYVNGIEKLAGGGIIKAGGNFVSGQGLDLTGLTGIQTAIVNFGEHIAIFVLALLLIVVGFFLLAEKQAGQIAGKVAKVVV